MNGQERGYFVKFARIQGAQSNYLQLFKMLCDHPHFNYQQLKNTHPSAPYLTNFPQHQTYLYKMILKSLIAYSEKNNIDIQIHTMLSELAVLETKGLVKQSAFKLNQLKKKIHKHHKYALLIELQKKEAIQLVAKREENLLEKTQKIYSSIFNLLEKLEEELIYRKLNHEMLLCYRQGASSDPHFFSDLLKSVSNHPLMKKEPDSESFYARYNKYKILSIEALIYGDLKIAYINYKKILLLWEAHPDLLKANPRIYKINISNFLGNAVLMRQTEDFEHYIQVMESLKSKNRKDEIETFQNVVYFRILFFLNKNLLQEGKVYIQSIKQQLIHWADQLNHARAVTIYYNTLTLHFLLEDFETAQDWASIILEERNKEIRNDVKRFARILNLIIHYELQHDRLFESQYNSIKRQLTKKHSYEEQILHFFKKLMDCVPGKAKANLLKDFEATLQNYTASEPRPLSIDELLIWLEARRRKISLQKVYAEKLDNQRPDW